MDHNQTHSRDTRKAEEHIIEIFSMSNLLIPKLELISPTVNNTVNDVHAQSTLNNVVIRTS